MSKSVKAMIKMTVSVVLCLVLGLALVGGLVGCGDDESTSDASVQTDGTGAGGDGDATGTDGDGDATGTDGDGSAAGGSADAGDLVGKWYSAELGETLEFTSDGKMMWTVDGGEAVTFDYSVAMGAIVFTQNAVPEDNTMAFTVEGSTLTTEDPKYGTATYTKQ